MFLHNAKTHLHFSFEDSEGELKLPGNERNKYGDGVALHIKIHTPDRKK